MTIRVLVVDDQSMVRAGFRMLLADEARSVSLFGDKRYLYVRAAGDEAHDALKALADSVDMGGAEPCPVLVVATSSNDKSRTAKLLEKRKDALVAMFYPPDLRSVADEVRAMAGAAGLKLDTGLSREGAPMSEWPALVATAARAQADGEVEVVGLWSHMAYADAPTHPTIGRQVAVFEEAVGLARDAGLTGARRHLANSAATVALPDTWYDMVRPGVAVYGLDPLGGNAASATHTA